MTLTKAELADLLFEQLDLLAHRAVRQVEFFGGRAGWPSARQRERRAGC